MRGGVCNAKAVCQECKEEVRLDKALCCWGFGDGEDELCEVSDERWCEVWWSGSEGDGGGWGMLRGMSEKTSTHYKKAPCSLSVVKYPVFIA